MAGPTTDELHLTIEDWNLIPVARILGRREFLITRPLLVPRCSFYSDERSRCSL